MGRYRSGKKQNLDFFGSDIYFVLSQPCYVFFCFAFLRDFPLCLDRLSGDASDTWRSPAI